jgi:phospholipase C
MSLCGYRKLQADRARSRWLIGFTFRITQWADDGIRLNSNIVSRAFYIVAKYLSLLYANLVNGFWLIRTQLMWLSCRLVARDKAKPDRIKHVFVLMLENRSFDHMLGFSQLQGVDALTGQPTTIVGLDAVSDWNANTDGQPVHVSSPADWTMPDDPGHEFPDVQAQLCGINGTYPHIDNSGFVANYAKVDSKQPGEIMKCYAPEQLPILTTLAREFAVCDHWFSSMPGPTWPNRFFIHAASSGGLDHSPSTENVATSLLINGYKFDNGTIFDRLDDEGISWTIYKGDPFPQALAINGMTLSLTEGRFRDFSDFNVDVQDSNYATSYAFIEPDYHVITDFVGGNSQHPKDDVTRGEALIKQVYETIRNSPHWDSSVLIVIYDEHGGFYDHVPPPQTVAPGDTPTDPENSRYGFDFTQLGVRVPAIIVSPLIPSTTIDHTIYDHTSVLATLEHIFGVQPLTSRDMQANSFYHLFSLSTPRTDASLTLPEPALSGIAFGAESEEHVAASQMTANPAKAAAPPDPALQGFLHVAYLRDRQASPPPEQEQRIAYFRNIHTRADAKRYLAEIRQKVVP